MPMRRLFCNLSIKNKLSAIMLLSNLFLISLISGGLIANEKIAQQRNLSADLLILADIMGANASAGLVFSNVQAAEDTLASLSAKPTIMQARIFDAEGIDFAHYFRLHYQAIEGQTNTHPESDNLSTLYFASSHSHSPPSGQLIEDKVFFEKFYAKIFKRIEVQNSFLGTVYIQADLTEIQQRLSRYVQMVAIIASIALLLTLVVARYLQRIITDPVLHLMHTMDEVTAQNNYRLRAQAQSKDEVGRLIHGFNRMLSGIAERDSEIQALNQRLRQENQRMSAELEVTQRLQKMLQPKECELNRIEDLDIACFMQPADEVGGDYYDVLYRDGQLKIGIGDVTGHGLESGVVMLMVQMAVRTLLANQVTDPRIFLSVLNEAVFDNVQRMNSDKNLTLTLLDYHNGQVRVSGQHEELLKVCVGGQVERIDTLDLGFMVGLTKDISAFIGEITLHLEVGEGIVLYTDGITEARNSARQMYGLTRLCESVSRHWQLADAKQIQVRILQDFEQFVGGEHLRDDITLLVLRRKGDHAES